VVISTGGSVNKAKQTFQFSAHRMTHVPNLEYGHWSKHFKEGMIYRTTKFLPGQ